MPGKSMLVTVTIFRPSDNSAGIGRPEERMPPPIRRLRMPHDPTLCIYPGGGTFITSQSS